MKSNKIKKIILDGFRAFPGRKVFDFEKEDSVADIIVIYAPNGTGKTSTIEGVEWATTGKISRIDRIITSNSSRNRNPKEGYILKNRQSSTPFATVSIELDNGDNITRTTKSKGNRNNDYCSGILTSTIENADVFGTNILSQGNINRFSYEASNGNLFNSLISSKDGLDDIKLYDQLNSLKIKIEASNSDNKSKIALLIKLIEDEEKRISELKSSNPEIHGIDNTEEYKLFKDEFYIFKDLSQKNLDEKIIYVNQSASALLYIKEKLLEFDIRAYRKIINRISILKNTISCESEVIKIQNIIDDLKNSIEKIERKVKETDNYLLDKNIAEFSSIINNYKDSTVSINNANNKVFKLNYVGELLYTRLSTINVDDIKDVESRVLQVENLLSSLFYDLLPEDVVLENESNYIKNIDSELTTLNTQLSLLSKDSFIALNPELDEVKKINANLLALENVNVRITQLTSEKNKLKSFGDKLGLIKSSIIDVVTENRLNDCPSCGTKFDSMTSLLTAINSVGAGADSLFDSALNDCNNQKGTISIEIEKLYKEIDTVISTQVINLEQKIKRLNAKKKDSIRLYSLLSTLNVNFISVKLNDIIGQLTAKKNLLNSKSLNTLRKKEKYGRWLNKINLILDEMNDQLAYEGNKRQQLMNNCIEKFGLSIDEVANKFSYRHVILFEKKKLNESKDNLHHLYVDNIANFNRLKNIISKFRVQEGLLNDLDLNKTLEISLINKKKIRTNYNYLKNNIKSFNINKITDLVDVISKLEGQFYSLNEWLKIEKDAFNRQNLLDDYKSQKQNKEGELKKGAENITSLNKSLEDALEYFSELASSSINNDILNDMFMYIEPHLKYDKINFKVDLSSGNKGIYIQAHSDENSESTTPVYYLSEAQINILSICIFLADHARKIDCGINAIIIDDPVQSMDDLNSYALIDLCKLFARRFGKQVIITTHNRSFFNLFKEKLPEFRYATKYISL